MGCRKGSCSCRRLWRNWLLNQPNSSFLFMTPFNWDRRSNAFSLNQLDSTIYIYQVGRIGFYLIQSLTFAFLLYLLLGYLSHLAIPLYDTEPGKETQSNKESIRRAKQKEREGFEPSIVSSLFRTLYQTGFQARSYQPLGHLSERELLFDLYYIPSNRIEHWHISWYHYSLDYISGVNLEVYLYGSRYIWSSIIPLLCEWKKERKTTTRNPIHAQVLKKKEVI